MKDKYKEWINYIASDIELPYLKSLEPYGLNKEDMNLVLSKVYNESVTIKDNHLVYDTNGNEIYHEYSDGFWNKWEYDANGNTIYCEYSDGFWNKWEYDTNDNEIYYETTNGIIRDNR